MNLADTIIPGLPKLAHTALAAPSFERRQWANRLNRAQRVTGKPCKIGYTRGSCGHYDVDGVFRPFGGPMVYSAWCECGRMVRYDGDEDGRRYAVKAHKAWAALGPRDVVTYHGPTHTGREFVILTVTEAGSLVLNDVEWGNVTLFGVDRAYVEPAGRQWVERTCAHPRYTRKALDGACSDYRCAG